MRFENSRVYSASNAGKVKIGSKGHFADNIEELKKVVSENHSHYITEVLDIYDGPRPFQLKNVNEPVAYFYLIEDK